MNDGLLSRPKALHVMDRLIWVPYKSMHVMDRLIWFPFNYFRAVKLPSQASDLCTKLIGLTIEKTVTFQNITLFECKVAKINYQERSTPTKCFGFGQIYIYINLSKLHYRRCVIVVIGTKLISFLFLINLKFEGL